MFIARVYSCGNLKMGPHKSEGEVVVEVVRLLGGRLPVGVWRVDFHFVLGLEENPGCKRNKTWFERWLERFDST